MKVNIRKDFAYAPLAAVLNLGESEKKIWLTLFTFQGQNDYCFPSLQAIRSRMGMGEGDISLSRISRITAQLVQKGWLEKWRRGRRNNYRVLIPNDLLFVPNFGSLTLKSETKKKGVEHLKNRKQGSRKQGSLNLETQKQSYFNFQKESLIDFNPNDYIIRGAGRFGSHFLKKLPNQDDSFWEKKYEKAWVEYGRSLGLSPENYEGFLQFHEVESYEEYLLKSGEMTREEISRKEEEYQNGKLHQVA